MSRYRSGPRLPGKSNFYSDSQGDSDATTFSEDSTRKSQRRRSLTQDSSAGGRSTVTSVTKRSTVAPVTTKTDLVAGILGQNRKENQTLLLFSSQESSDDADETCGRGLLLSKIRTMEMENAKLRKENCQLRNSLALFDKLPDLLERVEALSGAMEGHPCQTPAAAVAQKRTDIGGGVFVPDSSLRYIDHTKYRSLTSGLLTLLFSKEELRQSSLTGKRCNIHKAVDPKKRLDLHKLEALVGYVMEKCNVEKRQVVKVVKAKLNYEDKAAKPKPKPKPKPLDIQNAV